jgi:hypothetical protein
MTRRVRLTTMLALLTVGCAERRIAVGSAGAPGPRWTEAWLASEARRFLDDPTYRRAALEASLTNPHNLYSRQRLASYALETRGWDLLPVWNPRSVRVDAQRAAVLARGEVPALPPSQQPLWDMVTPTSNDGWIALGRRVFFEFPMRAEPSIELALTAPELAAAVGLERTSSGEVPGLVVFDNVDAETRVGITCALCHCAVKNGATVVGSARRSLDFGRLRNAYDQATGGPTDQAARMARWGPGRADVTEDDDEDPVTIPDLWGVREQTWLTQAATIRHDSPLALAIRQETQLIDSNHQLVRPPRALAWALAMFVYSLTPPRSTPADSALAQRGAAVFAQHCRGCHANAAYGGGRIEVARIGTHPALATGRGRGTDSYRTPPLVGVRDGAPYLHDGSVSSLDALLSAERLRSDVEAPSVASGHLAGTNLGETERSALVAYLQTL